MRNHMKKTIYVFFLAVAVLSGAWSLLWKSRHGSVDSNVSSSAHLENSAKLSVVTSFYPLYFFAERIGGDKAVVTNIVPAGAEPHDYEPTAQDMARMEKSRLIVVNGGGLEAWSDRLAKNISAKNTTIVVAGEGLLTREMTEDGAVTTDPHIWLDPVLAKKMAEKIALGFEAVDPEHAAFYRENAGRLLEQLDDLDAAYRNGLQTCAEKNIITSHAAFGYVAAEYGFNQVSIAGLSPDAEPSPSELARIAQFAKTNNVRYIFFESLASPKLSQTIAAEIGAKTLVLNPLEGLSDDELARGEDYFSVMYNNLVNLQTALQCNQ